MTLTNADLDAIRQIVNDRADQTEGLMMVLNGQLTNFIRFMEQQMQFHPKPGNQLQFQQPNPWYPNNQDQGVGCGWTPNPLAAANNDNSAFGIAFRKFASVEKLDESEFPKDLIDEFDKNFGNVIKFADFIKLSVAERTEIISSKLSPLIMSKAKEQMEKAGMTMPTSPDLFGGKDIFGGNGRGIF